MLYGDGYGPGINAQSGQITCLCIISLHGLRLVAWDSKMGGWWRWALVSPDGVAPSRMVYVSASVNFPFTIKSTSSLLAPAHLGGPGRKGCKTVVVVWWWLTAREFEGFVHNL